MTREQIASNKFLITPSLLNAWLYMWEGARNVKETDKDTISLEDKQSEAFLKYKQDFINTLKRLPSEPNPYMIAGIEFEEECYKGKTCISPIIKGGAYQIVGTKTVVIDGMTFVMYGRLDVLKGGVIYDIKRIWKYSLPKYKWSSQHGFYLDLFTRANKFVYLAYDGNTLHKETYYRKDCRPTIEIIREFIRWLKDNDLFDVYVENWKSKY